LMRLFNSAMSATTLIPLGGGGRSTRVPRQTGPRTPHDGRPADIRTRPPAPAAIFNQRPDVAGLLEARKGGPEVHREGGGGVVFGNPAGPKDVPESFGHDPITKGSDFCCSTCSCRQPRSIRPFVSYQPSLGAYGLLHHGRRTSQGGDGAVAGPNARKATRDDFR